MNEERAHAHVNPYADGLKRIGAPGKLKVTQAGGYDGFSSVGFGTIFGQDATYSIEGEIIASPIPEPATLLLLSGGLLGLVGGRRRWRG